MFYFLPNRLLKSLLSFIACCLIISAVSANAAVEIPRSTIWHLNEQGSERVYPIFVKLPRSYRFNKSKRYPVIYLTDAWYSFQIVSGATRFPMNSGVMTEAIIVGISYEQGSRNADSRIRDYTPIKDTSWKKNTGNAAQHTAFIQNVVFPFIDDKYRTIPQQRTYVGNSLGGLFGAYILLSAPGMFSSYILGSPSVWFRDNYLLSLPVKPTKRATQVYISVGSKETRKQGEKEEMVLGAQRLAKKLNDESTKNTLTKLVIVDGAHHATAFPTTAVQGLDWIYGK